MTERRAAIINTLTFQQADYKVLTFSNTALINMDIPEGNVRLMEQENGLYPTAANISVTSRLINANKIRSFLGFQATVRNFKGPISGLITSTGYRLTDGTNQYWWNGSAWVVNTSSWNTEADVATHISAFYSFALATKIFGAVVNLLSTDGSATPELINVKFAFEVKAHSLIDDIFNRSLLRDMLANLLPIADLAAQAVGGTSLDVGAAVASCGIPFKTASVDSIYSISVDPNLENDILSSFDSGTGIATLSSAITAGLPLRVQIVYTPEVAVLTTSPDYTEVGATPLVAIENIRTTDARKASYDDGIVNKSTGTAVKVHAPVRAQLDFDIRIVSPGLVDMMRVTEEVLEFVEQFQQIRSDATGDFYRLQMINEFDSHVSPQSNGVCETSASFRLHDVALLRHQAIATHAIERFNINIGNDTVVADASTGKPPLGDFPQQ